MTSASSPVPVMLMVRTLGPGGTERQVTEIAKALSPARFSAHVGCFDDTGFRAAELRSAGIPILTMRMTSFLSMDSPHVLLAMRRYLRQHAIRLVHTFDFPMNVFCAPAACLLRVPVVLSSQRSHRDLVPPKYIPALRVSDRLVDGIVVNCEAVRRHMRTDFGVADSKIDTCYNAIDTSQFRADARQRPPELVDASIVVGVVCVLRAIKSVETLIAGFATAAGSIPSARLVIVGDGPEKEGLQSLAAALGIEAQVVFVPGTNDVSIWLRAIDIFVLPSTSEALSNSLMEAMASGCCPVASRVGGNPELVIDGETGLLFEPANPADLAEKLQRLIADEPLRLQLANAAARRTAQDFSREKSIARIEEVYRQKLQAVQS